MSNALRGHAGALGSTFLSAYPVQYLSKAFELGRVFSTSGQSLNFCQKRHLHPLPSPLHYWDARSWPSRRLLSGSVPSEMCYCAHGKQLDGGDGDKEALY